MRISLPFPAPSEALMLVNERLTLRDLQERYPDPPRALRVGSDAHAYVHHGFAFGQTVLVIPALRECIALAKARGDAAALDHLRNHLKEYEAWQAERRTHRATQDAVTRGRTGRPAPSAMTAIH